MWKRALSVLTAVALVGLMASPLPVAADLLEDSFQECSYPPIADALFMRPLGFVGLNLGAVGVGVLLLNPVTIYPTIKEMPVVIRSLVVNPFKWTFLRRLGVCQAIKSGY